MEDDFVINYDDGRPFYYADDDFKDREDYTRVDRLRYFVEKDG